MTRSTISIEKSLFLFLSCISLIFSLSLCILAQNSSEDPETESALETPVEDDREKIPDSIENQNNEEILPEQEVEASDLIDAMEEDQANIGSDQDPDTSVKDEMTAFDQQSYSFVRQGTFRGERIRVPAQEVVNAIATGQDIDIEYAVIEGSLDPTLMLERDETGHPLVYGNIVIKFSEIHGYSAFSSVNFLGEVHFTSTTFVDEVDFSGATFNRYTDFNSANFNGDANFTDTFFRGNVEFISTTFKRDASFILSIFNGYGYFRSSSFLKDVSFEDANFLGATVFAGCTFTGQTIFARTSMEQPASFEDAKFRENTVIAGLWNNVFRTMVRLISFRKLNLPEITVTDFSQLDTGNILDASTNPYLKRYIDDEQWIISWRKSIWWREIIFVIWEITSHCGRSLGLWGFWSAVIATLFAVFYYRFLSDSLVFSVEKLKQSKPGFWGYLYYSIVTLTTLGYGDIVPLNNKARLAVGTEVVTGYIMLGGLISIFANKLARRS